MNRLPCLFENGKLYRACIDMVTRKRALRSRWKSVLGAIPG